MRKFISPEVIRFILVGFTNTANYYLLYLLFLHIFQWPYLVAHLLAFVMSMVGSFFLNCYFTYKTKPTWKKFMQFPLTYVVNVTVTTTSIWLLVDMLKLSETWSPLLASLIAIPFTFIISKKILKQ